MNRSGSLTEGNIFNSLVRLALPLMGTSFIQMAYALTDLIWLGRLSTDAVAAAGAVGFLTWFGSGIVLISYVGVGVKVAQSYGKDNIEEAISYSKNGIQFDMMLGISYALILFLFSHQIIGFFNLESQKVYDMAISYLRIISIGVTFNFLNPVFSNILNSTGDSLTPFKINTMGLVFNMILDPLLIFGLGPIPALGIKGAALATITAQIVVTSLFVIVGKGGETLYSNINIFSKPDKNKIKNIAQVGYPAFLQTSAQAGIGMVLARLITSYGEVGIAVQSIGSQIESLSWMTAEGFSAAISAFTGQNYGARKFDRIDDGYKVGMKIVGSFGIFATILLMGAGEQLFTIFTPYDPVAIEEGTKYLFILGMSQLFMSIEIGTAGVFNGIGRTKVPAAVGVFFNILRVPLAIFFSSYLGLGLTGIWWGITISSILKGIFLPGIFLFIVRPNLIKGNI